MNEPCPRCNGKGFLNPDGTAVNAFEGCDSDPTIPCPACNAKRIDIKAMLKDPEQRQRLMAALDRSIKSIGPDGTHPVPPNRGTA